MCSVVSDFFYSEGYFFILSILLYVSNCSFLKISSLSFYDYTTFTYLWMFGLFPTFGYSE
jgi:hypothetical protein